MSREEIRSLHEELLPHRAVQLAVLNEYKEEFLPPCLPPPICDIFDANFKKKPYDVVLAQCKRLLNEKKLLVTQRESDEIEKLTGSQSKCPVWMKYRAGYCTASNSRAICKTSKDPENLSLSLLKKIRYPAAKPFQNDATKYRENIPLFSFTAI